MALSSKAIVKIIREMVITEYNALFLLKTIAKKVHIE